MIRDHPLHSLALMAVLLSLSPHPHNHSPNPNPNPNPNPPIPKSPSFSPKSRRNLVLKTTSLFLISIATPQLSIQPSVSGEEASPPTTKPPPSNPSALGIVNTKSWFQFFGDGFSIRIPPQFQDIAEPEDYEAGLSLYGDKAKPKTYAARFASSDGSEVVSVIIRPTNQLKITFLEAKDITDLGSLKQAAKLFVPVGATLYSARTLKIKEEEGFRTYYYYEFGNEQQRVGLVAAVNGGRAIVAAATAPQSTWDEDAKKLRSAAISMTVL